ncbi:MAG: PH domain-containing protein, partial [Sciscionella sp.]
MPYPDDLLGEDEEIIVHQHPHWKMLIVPVIIFVIAVGGGAYLATLLAGQSWRLAGWIAIGVV